MMKVVHPFIEAGVGGGLDDSALQVVIVENFEGSRIPQKNTETRIGNRTTIARSCRAYVNATTESAKFRQIWEVTTTHLMRAGWAGAMRDEVIKTYEMIIRVWPECGTKSSAGQHSSECVANGLVRTFAGTSLVGRIGPGELDLISEIVECLADLVTFTKFATTVHTYILVATWGCVIGKPLV